MRRVPGVYRLLSSGGSANFARVRGCLALLMLATSVSVSAQLTEGIGAPAPMTGNGSVQSQVPAPGRVEETTSAIGQAGAQPNGVPVNTGTQAAMNPAPVSASPQISVGDLLEISIFDTPELSSRLRVNNHGEVVLPLAGGVHVEGLTAPEAAQAISKKYIEAKLLVLAAGDCFYCRVCGAGRDHGG